MPNTFENLNLTDARQIIDAASARADALNVPCSIAVVDAGGHLLCFTRQDGAMPGSGELAINKAFTAVIFQNTTEGLGASAKPDSELFGIQHSHGGRVVAFGGGAPIHSDGSVIGAVGVSGGSVAQDIEIADAARTALFPMPTSPGTVQRDLPVS